jgi:toxin-antitoxin system PIN domain toxin
MTKTPLLDVNVLVALFDPEHIHHEAAHAWFGDPKRTSWATCPLTENGLVRIVSNPRYPGRRTTIDEATHRLKVFCRHEDHTFWQDSVTVRDAKLFQSASIRDHSQLTDIYLLALATTNQGALVTFDRSIPTSAVTGANSDHILLLPA